MLLQLLLHLFLLAHIPWLYDPSGYVYDAIPANRLDNVTTTLIVKDPSTGIWTSWDATKFGQINPQTTDLEGRYGWDVPDGDWQVIYEKSGYQRTNSSIIHVPPPRTDVNAEMVSLEPPKIIGVMAIASNSTGLINDDNSGGGNNNYTEKGVIDVLFDKYVNAGNLTNATITVFHNILINKSDVGGGGGNNNNYSNSDMFMERVAGTVDAFNPSSNSEGLLLAHQARFVPSVPLIAGDSYSVVVSNESPIQSYAGIPLESGVNNIVVVVSALNYTLQLLNNDTQIVSPSSSSSSEEVTIGQSLNAITFTNNTISTKTTFLWYGPDGSEVLRDTVRSSPEGIAKSDHFTPTETGIWRVDALFTSEDNNTILKTKSISFNVGQAE